MVYTIIGHFLSPMPFGVSLFTTEAVQQALGAKGLASPMPFGVSQQLHHVHEMTKDGTFAQMSPMPFGVQSLRNNRT